MSWFLGNQIQHNIQKTPHHQAQHPEKQALETLIFTFIIQNQNPTIEKLSPKFQTKSPEPFIQIPIEKTYTKISR